MIAIQKLHIFNVCSFTTCCFMPKKVNLILCSYNKMNKKAHKRYKETFGGDRHVYYLDCGHWCLIYIQTHQIKPYFNRQKQALIEILIQ